MAKDTQKIPVGYRFDPEANIKRDTREITLAYLGNIHDQADANDMMRRYDDCYYEPNQIVAAAKRKSIISEIWGPSVVWTNNVLRCYIDGNALALLSDLLYNSSLSIGMARQTSFNNGRRRYATSLDGAVSRREFSNTQRWADNNYGGNRNGGGYSHYMPRRKTY